jgi:hypothetical protein
MIAVTEITKRRPDIGNRYNELTIVFIFREERLYNCLAQCSCGNIKKYSLTNVKNGKVTSCGCRWSRKELSPYYKYIGITYSYLTVLDVIKNLEKGRWEFLTQCICGKRKTFDTSTVLRSNTKSCGCKMKELAKKKWENLLSTKMLPDNLGAKRRVLNSYKRSAKRRKIQFDLNEDEFIKLCESDCYYCGIKPHRIHKTGRYSKFIYNGIDRRDNKNGYTTLNSVPCCKDCNIAKQDNTEEYFLNWIERLYNRKKFKNDNN